jgi:hypothetical protein
VLVGEGRVSFRPVHLQFRSALRALLRQRPPARLLVGQIGLPGHSEASCLHAMVSVAHRPPSFRVMNQPSGTCSMLAAAGCACVSRRAGKARKRRSILHVARRCAGRVPLQGAGPCDASFLLRSAGRRGRSGPVSTCKVSKSRSSGDAIQGSHVGGWDPFLFNSTWLRRHPTLGAGSRIGGNASSACSGAGAFDLICIRNTQRYATHTKAGPRRSLHSWPLAPARRSAWDIKGRRGADLKLGRGSAGR